MPGYFSLQWGLQVVCHCLPSLACPDPVLLTPTHCGADAASHSPYTWQLPGGASPEDCVWLWVGPEESPLLQQLQMSLHGAHWAMYSPSEQRWQVCWSGFPTRADGVCWPGLCLHCCCRQ